MALPQRKTSETSTWILALKKAGIAPRLQRAGWQWLQPADTDANLHAGVFPPGEGDYPAPDEGEVLTARVDSSIREEVVYRISATAFQRVCETRIQRDCSAFVREGDPRAVPFPARESRTCEHSPPMFDTFAADGAPRTPRLSERARDYLSAEAGRTDPSLAPRDAQDVALDPAQTAEQAARQVLCECLNQIATNVRVIRRLDHIEGPHQLRVGLRRLRSAFSVYRSVLQCLEMDRLDAEARWLSQEVGSLRDLDVVANDMVRREAETYPDEPELSALAHAVSCQAQARREQLCQLLAGARVQAFLTELAQFVETRGWLAPQDYEQPRRLALPVADLASKALRKRWKKVVSRTRELEALSIEQRHELRKDLKKMRYAVEFFSCLFPQKHVDPFLKRLKKMQTLFGDLNDAAMARALFRGAAIPGMGEPGMRHAVGWMIGASQARAEFGWTGAKTLWRDLEKTRLFWR